MLTINELMKWVAVGVGATVVMDGWSMLLKISGLATLDYALVGRWAGHLLRGRLAHSAIARAEPVAGERLLGWMIHYAVGIAFALLLAALQGGGWLHQPTWLPALAAGAATVVFPLFVMQPAMGAGFAAARTAAPLKNCLRSLANHAVFGSGLYLSAFLLGPLWA